MPNPRTATPTPGPWRKGITGGTVVCDTPTGHRLDEDCIRYYGGHLIAESIWREADADLIAAAPQLLESLSEIMDGQLGTGTDLDAERFRKARALLAHLREVRA